MPDSVRDKFYKHRCYYIVQQKNRCIWYFNDISDHVKLGQLIDNAGNINHAVIITECWIYDYNYKISLTLIKGSLDIILSSSKDNKWMYYEFKDVYYAVRYVNSKAKCAKTE